MTPSGLTPSTALTTTSRLCRGLAIGRQYVPASKRSGDTGALYLDAFQFTSFCRSRFSEARTRVFERTEITPDALRFAARRVLDQPCHRCYTLARSRLENGVRSGERRQVRRAVEVAGDDDQPPRSAQSVRCNGAGGRILARRSPRGRGGGAVQEERRSMSNGLRVLLVLLSSRDRTLCLPSGCPDLPQAARTADRAVCVLRARPAARS
jgi:hypothetical protein